MIKEGFSPRRGWWEWSKAKVYARLIQPFLESREPVGHVALGAAVGTFFGFTPTVGIQSYLVILTWLLFRYVFRTRFNLMIAVAMVWISNPLTMVPMYYAFLVTGQWMQDLAGIAHVPVSYAAFGAEVQRLSMGGEGGGLLWLYNAARVLIVEFGWPMVLGCLVYGIPGAIFAYPFTWYALGKYRRLRASAEGISYEQWQAKYVTRLS